jgi:Na+/melibiose symporter-like transporter
VSADPPADSAPGAAQPASAALPLRRNRRFASLYLADTVSAFGDRVHALALYILVFNLTGRALDIGALAIAQVLPATLLAPFSGWLIDRVDRRRMMAYMDVLRCGLVLLVPTATSLPQILAIAALLSVARQFHEPARMAVLPSIVAPRQIMRANALTVATLHLLLLIGPAVGGLLIAALGTTAAFQIDACTYVASALLLLGVGRVPPPLHGGIAPGGHPVRAFLAETRQGATLVWGDRPLRFAIGFFALTVLITSLQQPMLVLFVKQVLRTGSAELGLVMSMAGLGGILGSVLAQPLRRFISPLRLIPVACAADGAALVLFALMRTLAPALVLVAVFGLLGGLIEVHVVSLFQERVPEQARGRAFGWLGPVFGPLSVGSIGAGALLAERFGVVAVLIASGALEATWALLALGWLRRRPLLLAQAAAEHPAPATTPRSQAAMG